MEQASHSVSSRHRAFLRVDPAENQSLDWYLHVHDDFRDLLTLLVGEPVYTRHFNVHGADPKYDGRGFPQVALLFRQDADRGRKEALTSDMLVAYPAIQERIASVLDAWFSRSEQLRTAHDLFFHTFYNTRPYLRSEFLSLAHALETYDRSAGSSEYLPEAEYSPVCSTLIGAIPQGLSDGLRARLKSQIKYGNEFSFRKRLTNLLAGLAPSTATLVCDDCSAFVGRIVDTRNYFTHYTDELKQTATLETNDLFRATHRLRILLTILLLKGLGIDENTIGAAIRGNDQLNFIYPAPTQGDAGSAEGQMQGPLPAD